MIRIHIMRFGAPRGRPIFLSIPESVSRLKYQLFILKTLAFAVTELAAKQTKPQ